MGITGKNERFLQRIEELSGHGIKFLAYPSQIQGELFVRLALGSIHSEAGDLDYRWETGLKAVGL